MVYFAIIYKQKRASPVDPNGELAGMVSYMKASEIYMSAEVGSTTSQVDSTPKNEVDGKKLKTLGSCGCLDVIKVKI